MLMAFQVLMGIIGCIAFAVLAATMGVVFTADPQLQSRRFSRAVCIIFGAFLGLLVSAAVFAIWGIS